MAAILKTVKSPYLGNHLADFDEIGHIDALAPYSDVIVGNITF